MRARTYARKVETIPAKLTYQTFAIAVTAASAKRLDVMDWIDRAIKEQARLETREARELEYREAQRSATQRNRPPLHREEFYRQRGWL